MPRFLLNLGILRCLILIRSYPMTLISPEVGTSSRRRSFIKVDFPEPLSPTINTNSPFFICKSTPLSAGAPVAYALLTLFMVIISSPDIFFFFLPSFSFGAYPKLVSTMIDAFEDIENKLQLIKTRLNDNRKRTV